MCNWRCQRGLPSGSWCSRRLFISPVAEPALGCLQPPDAALQETGSGRARDRVPPCSSSKNRALGKAEALSRREGGPAKLAADRINDATAMLRGGPRYSGKAASGQDGPLSWRARPPLGSLGEETEQIPESRHCTPLRPEEAEGPMAEVEVDSGWGRRGPPIQRHGFSTPLPRGPPSSRVASRLPWPGHPPPAARLTPLPRGPRACSLCPSSPAAIHRRQALGPAALSS